MKNKALIYIGGILTGLVLAGFMVAGANIMGAIKFDLTAFQASPAMVTDIPEPSFQAVPPTETIVPTRTFVPSRTPQPPTETGTPTFVAKTCNHTNGVYVLITVEDGKAVYYANDDCLMMSIKGLGKPVYGTLMEDQVEVLGRKFIPYKFTCDIKSTRESDCGLYLEELVFTQFAINDIGWAQNDYGKGDYAFFMIFATQTPNP